jgi:sarcosine oxidase subunit delta
MLIACPFCGLRDEAEFTYLGAAPEEAAPAAEHATAFARTYLRDNPAGAHRELWLHTYGCRSVVTVERNTLTHAVASVAFAGGEP